MKKKMAAAVAAAVMAVSAAGCSQELSNQYVTVTQYKGLEVAKVSDTEVSDDDVEQAIQTNLESTATELAVTDRAAQNGDWVNIDYSGSVDGEVFDGGTAQDQEIQLGQAGFVQAEGDYKGFEEQIEGHNVGEEFDITVQFPEDYYPDMAGKVAVFHIVLNEIFEKQIPELTDEWVKENSDTAENVDEYRKEIRTQYAENAESTAQSELEASVQAALLDKIEVKKYPEDAVQKLTDQMTSYYEQLAGVYGIELNEFIQTYMQMSEDDFNAQIQDTVQQQVVFDEAVALIAKKEKLEPSEKEYEEKIAEYAKQAGADDVDAYKEQVGEDTLRKGVLSEVVTKYLADKCVQVEE